MTDPRAERDPLAGFRAPPPDAVLRARTLATARAALERRAAPDGWRAALAALRASPALASLVALLLLAHALLFLVPSSRRNAGPDHSPGTVQLRELAAAAPEVSPLPKARPMFFPVES